MRYYATNSGPLVRDAMRAGYIGALEAPAQGANRAPEGVPWIADNGAYGKSYPGPDRWFAWLTEHPAPELCAFAIAPDVVGDAAATLDASLPWLPRIRDLGIPAALALQDGIEDLSIPWSDLDVVFLGGSTLWKLGPAARQLTAAAVDRGKPVHMGRVNSERRYAYARAIGCSSADGTILKFGPGVNLRRVLAMVRLGDQYALDLGRDPV